MKEWVGEREIQKMAAYGYSIKNKKFEMTVSVPRDDIEDDQYGVYTPLFSNMGEAAAEHPDTLVFETMKKGWKTKKHKKTNNRRRWKDTNKQYVTLETFYRFL